MSRKTTTLTQLVVLQVLFTAACRERANPKDEPPPSRPQVTAALDQPKQKAPPDWASAMKHTITVDPMRSAVVVTLDLAPGFHAYTVGETVGKPLKLEIAPDGDVDADGPPAYPAGEAKDLPLGRSVIVQGHAEIVAKVKAKSGDLTGKRAKGTFYYQVCTEEACDRPKSLPFEVASPGN